MLDQDWIMEQLRKMFMARLGELPQEAKAALVKTPVTIVRRPDCIEIYIDSRGDADVEKVKDLLLDGMITPMSQVVGFLGCRVEVKPQTG